MLGRWLENEPKVTLACDVTNVDAPVLGITGALWHSCGWVFVVVNAALLLRLKNTDRA